MQVYDKHKAREVFITECLVLALSDAFAHAAFTLPFSKQMYSSYMTLHRLWGLWYGRKRSNLTCLKRCWKDMS